MNTFEKDERYIAHAYGRLPLEFSHGAGSAVYGTDGKRYIDLGSGIAVNIFGLCDREWTAAVENQLSRFAHTSNYYIFGAAGRILRSCCAGVPGLKGCSFPIPAQKPTNARVETARKYPAAEQARARTAAG